MKKENFAFLLGGLVFGILFGYALFNAMESAPDVAPGAQQAQAQTGPAGPMAPTQVGTSGAPGGAPMMAEINALKRRLQEDPQDVASLVRLANVYHDAAMWDQAVGYYERALELRPDDPDLLTDLGISLRGMQQYDRALELFDRAQAADPKHWQSLFNTVIVAGFDVGQFDRANAALEKMEAMTPPPPRLDELRLALERARDGARPEGRS